MKCTRCGRVLSMYNETRQCHSHYVPEWEDYGKWVFLLGKRDYVKRNPGRYWAIVDYEGYFIDE